MAVDTSKFFVKGLVQIGHLSLVNTLVTNLSKHAVAIDLGKCHKIDLVSAI